jgi:hypothetical protein
MSQSSDYSEGLPGCQRRRENFMHREAVPLKISMYRRQHRLYFTGIGRLVEKVQPAIRFERCTDRR